MTYNEEREWNTIDDDIAALEKQIAEKEAEMESNVSNYSILQSLIKDKEELEKQYNEKMDRWVYLSELYEKIKSESKQ